VEFHKDPLNRRRNTKDKVLCFSSKVHSVIDRSQRNLHNFHSMGSLDFRKFSCNNDILSSPKCREKKL